MSTSGFGCAAAGKVAFFGDVPRPICAGLREPGPSGVYHSWGAWSPLGYLCFFEHSLSGRNTGKRVVFAIVGNNAPNALVHQWFLSMCCLARHFQYALRKLLCCLAKPPATSTT